MTASSSNGAAAICMILGSDSLRLRQQQAEDSEYALSHVLSFLGDAKSLALLRTVSRDFGEAVDRRVVKETQQLIGKHVKPTIGQTPCELLRAAQMLSAVAKKWLLEWVPDPDHVREGFVVGLPNMPNDNIHATDGTPLPAGEVLARVPCQGSAKGSFIPCSINFQKKQELVRPNDNSLLNRVRLPLGFFHLHVCPYSGEIEICSDMYQYVFETSLNDTLRRIQNDLHNDNDDEFNTPARDIYIKGSVELYLEYKVKCMKLFQGYRLTQRDMIPDLTLVQKAVETQCTLLPNE